MRFAQSAHHILHILVVIHPRQQPGLTQVVVRLTSARKATKEEVANYLDKPRSRLLKKEIEIIEVVK